MMNETQMLNIVAFLALMQGGDGLLDKSPDYIAEKFLRYCNKTDTEEYKWGLDSDNQLVMLRWKMKWGIKGGEEHGPDK